jgi:capsular exopolysaccharide synthesis family protein
MELGVYLRPLKRWWWLLLAATLLAAASSYWYVRDQPLMYEARTTLMIGRGFDDPNPTNSELTLGQQLAATYADLAKRRLVREQTMLALGLSALPAFNATPLPNGQMLEIVVVDTDPQRAQLVANELANQLILLSPTSPKPEEQEREAFINEQLASLQESIPETEAEIAAKQAELENAIGALEINKLQSEITALDTKLRTLQANYAALLANTSDGSINTIAVIEPASLPRAPTASGQAELILVASGIALALAVGTAYLLEYLDDIVRTTDDLARVGSFNSLPGIPKFHKNGGGPPIIASDAPNSPVSDAFRALRTGVVAATATKRGKILLITSSVPKEGKSLVAANLSKVLTQGGKSVLLIDADLHRPTQHQLFNVSRDYGLAELLVALEAQGHLGAEALIQRGVHQLETMSLGLIVAGSDFAGAAGLLGSDTMKLLLDTVVQHTDYVILDSPPLLAVSDALMLSTLADGVIMVASAGTSHRKQIETSLRGLNDVNANVVGVVLNRQRRRGNGYYNAYYRNLSSPRMKKR